MGHRTYELYKDSGIEWIGKIPEHWMVMKLKRCFKVYNGREILNEIDKNEDGIDVFGSGGAFKKTDNYIYNQESVLFGRKGTIGKPIYVNYPFWTVDTMYYTKYKGGMYPKFFYYVLKTFPWEIHTTTTALPSIVGSDIENEYWGIPAFFEQKEIADFLDDICYRIDKSTQLKKQQIATLQKYLQSLITETVTKGLNPDVKIKNSGVQWIGDIPEHWDLKRLRYLGVLQNGISKSSEHFGHGFPFVSYGDVYKNIELPNKVKGLVNSTLSDRRIYSVERGDVFFTRTSETVQEIGFTSTCLETIEEATFAGFLIRFRPSLNNLIPNYSKYYFRSNIHRNHFVKEMNLVTRASLSQELLKKLPVLLPPKEEQVQIADYLDEKCFYIETLIKENQQIIEHLEKYKNSLIYEAVTGKIDVRNYKESELEVKL